MKLQLFAWLSINFSRYQTVYFCLHCDCQNNTWTHFIHAGRGHSRNHLLNARVHINRRCSCDRLSMQVSFSIANVDAIADVCHNTRHTTLIMQASSSAPFCHRRPCSLNVRILWCIKAASITNKNTISLRPYFIHSSNLTLEAVYTRKWTATSFRWC